MSNRKYKIYQQLDTLLLSPHNSSSSLLGSNLTLEDSKSILALTRKTWRRSLLIWIISQVLRPQIHKLHSSKEVQLFRINYHSKNRLTVILLQTPLQIRLLFCLSQKPRMHLALSSKNYMERKRRLPNNHSIFKASLFKGFNNNPCIASPSICHLKFKFHRMTSFQVLISNSSQTRI